MDIKNIKEEIEKLKKEKEKNEKKELEIKEKAKEKRKKIAAKGRALEKKINEKIGKEIRKKYGKEICSLEDLNINFATDPTQILSMKDKEILELYRLWQHGVKKCGLEPTIENFEKMLAADYYHRNRNIANCTDDMLEIFRGLKL